MLDAPQDPTPELEEAEGFGTNPGLARRLANLRPAWTSESAPRHGGRAKDGGGTKDAPLRKELRRQLRRRNAQRRLVEAWIESACSGDSQAREQILKRLDPVIDDPAAGRTVLEGLRLELTHRGAALTVGRASGPMALPEPSDVRMLERDSDGGALTSQESREGAPQQSQESHLLRSTQNSGMLGACSEPVLIQGAASPQRPQGSGTAETVPQQPSAPTAPDALGSPQS